MILDFRETTHDTTVVFQVEETVHIDTGLLQKTEVKKCKYCNLEHDLDKTTNCPAFGKTFWKQGE